MGCTKAQRKFKECQDNEKPAHEVTLTRRVWAAETEVTQSQYKAVTGSNPSAFKGADRPVENVSWYDALAFANALSKEAGLEPCYEGSGESWSWPKGLDCVGFRLPTEAEWEYAARAGQDTLYAGGNAPGSVAWTVANSGGQTHPVAQKQPNTWGFYDMSGNVREWIWDGYGEYSARTSVDPTGNNTTSRRVNRGGSWYLNPASRGSPPATSTPPTTATPASALVSSGRSLDASALASLTPLPVLTHRKRRLRPWTPACAAAGTRARGERGGCGPGVWRAADPEALRPTLRPERMPLLLLTVSLPLTLPLLNTSEPARRTQPPSRRCRLRNI